MGLLLILFLLIFPKGGIKLGDLPVTWGYLLLGLASVFLLARKRFRFTSYQLKALLCILPFQLLSLFTLANAGIENTSTAIAFFITFFLLPIIFFLLLPSSIEEKHLQWIRHGVFWISIYGIALFFYKFFIGSFIEIPFLTVNFHDFGQLEETKNISRLEVFKLISTYNNGNLFGACVLMLMPLYALLEKSRRKRILVRVALLLTLSRTVWLGLLLFEILKGKKRPLKSLMSIALLFLAAIGLTLYFGFSNRFLLDLTFGGRSSQFDVLQSMQYFSSEPFTFFYEIVYLGVLKRFGIVGLITFFIAMCAPLAIYFLHRKTLRTEFSRPFYIGMLVYLGICFSDGSTLLIPTMCIYWLIASLLVRGCLQISDVFISSKSVIPSNSQLCSGSEENCCPQVKLRS